MSGALYLPGADRTTRWFLDDYPSSFVMPRIDKDLLHSTETRKTGGCPGYSGGATAPQVTINPWSGYRKTWQHLPINRAGRALRNPDNTPVSENKDNVFQVEIIGFSDPALGRQYGCYLPELDDAGLEYIAEMLWFVHKEWPHPTTLPPTWPLYKVSSWTAMGDARMSSVEYDSFRGILAHLHASGNTHGDVAIKIQTLKAKLDRKIGTTTPGSGGSVVLLPYPGHQHSNERPDDWHVGRIQKRLKVLGFYTMTVDSKFGPGTKTAVSAFQKQQDIKVDGVVGPTTWARLKIPA